MKCIKQDTYRTTQRFDKVGLSAFESHPSPPAGHVHDAIEVSAFEHGAATMLYGGTSVTIAPDQLVLHWGMLPHQVLDCPVDTRVVGLHLPLVWFLQWDLPSSLLTRVLGLDLIIAPRRERPCSDLELLRDWNQLLTSEYEISREIVLSEVRARLLRLSLTQTDTSGQIFSEIKSTHIFLEALRFIIRHFRESISLTDIAEAASVSSRHLSRLFQQNTGQTINTYITGLRLSHTMRLLVTTDRTVTDIMYDAGFSCTTHFYKAFRAKTGCTPRQYRQ